MLKSLDIEHVGSMPQQIKLTLPKLELPKLQRIDG